jgi:hypothetical protein
MAGNYFAPGSMMDVALFSPVDVGGSQLSLVRERQSRVADGKQRNALLVVFGGRQLLGRNRRCRCRGVIETTEALRANLPIMLLD